MPKLIVLPDKYRSLQLYPAVAPISYVLPVAGIKCDEILLSATEAVPLPPSPVKFKYQVLKVVPTPCDSLTIKEKDPVILL